MSQFMRKSQKLFESSANQYLNLLFRISVNHFHMCYHNLFVIEIIFSSTVLDPSAKIDLYSADITCDLTRTGFHSNMTSQTTSHLLFESITVK